jgi:class 3 adenylate cyclase/tetratricopeptide (TPR) repeat protein
MKVCPSCGRENPTDARFCSYCATPLDAAAAPREERKVVTVVFADLVGFTARSEKLDPEDVRAILMRYHKRVRADLERHGGTVEKFIGDAVMALFGAPAAHEDDPERAVRAALAIREWAGDESDLQVRIGITTGEALVSLGVGPAAVGGMVAGDIVNTAARLQASAPADGILVDETTYRATARAIEYREHPPIAAKGKAHPVAVWEANQARARFGVDVRQVAPASLVGRDEELGTLVAALARVIREREPQLVTLVGEPGIGKSRLVWELFRTVEQRPELVQWRQGRSLPYGDGIALWALGEMVKAQAGILESDGGDSAVDKLAGAVEQVVADDPEWVLRHLRPLIGAEGPTDGSTDRRIEAFAAWRRFFEACADARPLVLVFEDLHWADESLLDFVDYLVEWAAGVPLLVVATARPELLARRPDWSGGKTNAATLRIGALTDDETARLVHELLDRPVLPAQLQSALITRAGGNPLYAEEFVRLLGDDDSTTQMPESVQGIIAARLDTLPPVEKAVLQDGAILGKVFWQGAVAAIGDGGGLEARLHELERKEFLRRERRSSVGGEVEYAFRHALVRDAAYALIPRSDRAEKHVRAADWIDGLGRPDDHADLLAHHLVSALELSRAAGTETAELADRARRALRSAGDRAAALGSYGAARSHYGQALELGAPDDAERPQLLLSLGKTSRFGRTAQDAGNTLRAASDALQAAGDLEGTVEAEAMLGEVLFESMGVPTALGHLERAEALAQKLPASRAKAHCLSSFARVLMFTDRSDEAIENAREALEIADQLGLADVCAQALVNLGTARWRAGDRSGADDIRRGIEIAVAANSPECLRGYWNLGIFLGELGEMDEAYRLAAEGRRAAERFGVHEQAAILSLFEVGHHLGRGEWEKGLTLWADVVRVIPPGDFMVDTNRYFIESVIAIARGELELGVGAASDGLEYARTRRPGDSETVGSAFVTYAWALCEAGRQDEAQRLAGDLEATLADVKTPTIMSAFMLVGLVLDELGLNQRLREISEALPESPWRRMLNCHVAQDFPGAADQFGDLGLFFPEALLRVRAARALVDQGRRREADEQLDKALPLFRSVGATHFVRKSESLLAASA